MTTISCVQISNFKNEWYNSLKAPPTPSFSHSLYLPLPLSLMHGFKWNILLLNDMLDLFASQ